MQQSTKDKRISLLLGAVSVSLAFVLSAALPFFKIEPVYAQQTIDNSAVEKQRLGTSNILYLPEVHILFSNVQNVSLNQQFIILGNNKNTSHKTQNNSNVAIANPDYTLLNTNQTLRVGQNFRINSTTDQDIQYTTANVTLVPLASPLPPNTKLSDIDPETDLIQQTPLIALGSYQGNIHNFIMPQVAHPRYYLLDISLNYSSQGMTVVYSTIVRIVA